MELTELFYRDLLRYSGEKALKIDAKVISIQQATRIITDFLTAPQKGDTEGASKARAEVLRKCSLGDPVARIQVGEMTRKALIDLRIEVPGMTLQDVIDEIYAYNWGFDILQKFYDDAKTEELYGNNHHQLYRVIGNKRERLAVRFKDQYRMEKIIERITSGNKTGPAGPTNCLVATDLLDGSRVTARMPPVARWPSFNIRKHNNFPIEMPSFIQNGTFSEDVAYVLEALAWMYANIVVIGPTKIGKTTMLKLLLKLTPPDDRLILLERNREIKLQDVPGMESRDILELQEAQQHGYSLERVFESVLQGSPDRIIACEVLGPEEIIIMMFASSRGHEGNMSSYHLTNPYWSVESFAQQYSRKENQDWRLLRPAIAACQNVIIYLDETQLYRRKLLSIVEIDYDHANDCVIYNDLVKYDQAADEYSFFMPKSEDMKRKMLRLSRRNQRGTELLEAWQGLASLTDQKRRSA